MNRLKLAAGVILIFLVGVLAGTLGTGEYLKGRMDRFGPGGPPPHLRKAMVVKRMASELDLTEAQRAEIEKIVEETETRVMDIRRQYLPEIKQALDQGFELMKAKLDGKQKKKLEGLKGRIENRHARAFINSITPGKRPEQTVSTLRKRLNLTQDQAAMVLPIIEEEFKRLTKIIEIYRGKDHPKVFSMRREVGALRMSTEKRLKGVLTQGQLEEYRRMQKRERIERRLETGRRRLERLD